LQCGNVAIAAQEERKHARRIQEAEEEGKRGIWSESFAMTGPQGRTLREENSRTALTALAGPTDDSDSSGSSCGDQNATRLPQYFAALLGKSLIIGAQNFIFQKWCLEI